MFETILHVFCCIAVTVEAVSSYGYLSAIDFPLLPVFIIIFVIKQQDQSENVS